MSSDVTVFAETNFRNQRRRFGIKLDDRRRHMYVVGKTGMGKSTLLENTIIADIRAGHGVAVVDPHGDLAEEILRFIPNNRVNDVIYFNPADTQYPIAFNILETVGPEYKHLVAYGLVGVFKKIWADSWGPRMEYIMTNTILALLDYPGSTLLGVMRMLVDKAYRKKVVSKVTDPVVKTFWADEFANYSEKFRTEAIAPIQNKVGQFLSSSIIRNIVGQSKSTIEMRKIMDEQKIVIMNLAKGRIGEENSALLGAMMITKLQIAAMSRVDIPEEERKDFYLYVDEFQNFATDSFAGILSEARKYRLCLIMAHQYFEQLNDMVKAAVFGNVGTMIIFRVGATDAAELELEFAPQFTPADIVNLKKYTFCMRLMVDGVATEPFSAIGLPPVTGITDNRDKAIRVSRERYARPQNLVEERIIRWSGVEVARAPGSTAPEGMVAAAVGDDVYDDELLGESTGIIPAVEKQSVEAQPKDDTMPDLSVNLSTIIPGEQTDENVTEKKVPGVNMAAAAAEVPSRPTLSSVQSPAQLSSVHVPSSAGRPKINFVPSDSDDTVAQASAQAMPPPASEVIRPDRSVPAIPQQSAQVKSTPVVPAPTKIQAQTISPAPEVIRPGGPTVRLEQSTASSPARADTISLSALQRGTAPQVAFRNVPRDGRADQPPSSPNFAVTAADSNDPNAQQRKRRRKRNRNRSGGGLSAPSLQQSVSVQRPQQQSQPLPSPRPQQPSQKLAQQPAQQSFQQAARPPQPQPQSQSQPSSAPRPPAPANDPTKVSLKDLI